MTFRLIGGPLNKLSFYAPVANTIVRIQSTRLSKARDRSIVPVKLDELRDALQVKPSTSVYRCSDLSFLNMACGEHQSHPKLRVPDCSGPTMQTWRKNPDDRFAHAGVQSVGLLKKVAPDVGHSRREESRE